jgi:translation initiation factor IF-2
MVRKTENKATGNKPEKNKNSRALFFRESKIVGNYTLFAFHVCEDFCLRQQDKLIVNTKAYLYKKEMEAKKETKEEDNYTFKRYKSYSVDEILATGGTTAFANKLGKNPENITKRLAELPDDAFLTEEEFQAAMATLNASK